MTTATFSQDGGLFEVRVTGHAGYNPSGPDIVCAACSTLACTLQQCMLAAEAEGALEAYRGEREDGELLLRVRPARWAWQRIHAMLEMAAAGYALLQQQYPDHVRLVQSGEKSPQEYCKLEERRRKTL